MSFGSIDVLHVTKGHNELKFDSAADAKTKITDLMKSGHSIMLEFEGQTYKATGFDETTGEYLCSETKAVEKRIPLASAKATAVAPQAGG